MSIKRSSSVPLIVGIAASLCLCVGLAGFWLGNGGYFRLRPGPIAGDANVELTFTSTTGDGVRDGAAMAARLKAVRVQAEVIESGKARIVLRAERVESVQAVVDVVSSRRVLGLYLVDDQATDFTPSTAASPSPQLKPTEENGRQLMSAPTPDPVLALIAATPLPRGRVAKVKCAPVWGASPSERCVPLVLERPSILGNAQILAVRAMEDEQTGHPVVAVELDAAGAARFANVTRANIQRRLAIVLDDQVVSAPLIMSAIEGGKMRITMGSGDEPSDAQLLAATLAADHALLGSWKLAEKRLF